MNSNFYISKLHFTDRSNFDVFKDQYTYLFIQFAGNLDYKSKWSSYSTLENEVSDFLSKKYVSFSNKDSDFLYSSHLISDPVQQEFLKTAFSNESNFSRKVDNRKILLLVMINKKFYESIKKDLVNFLNQYSFFENSLIFNKMSFDKLSNSSLNNIDLFHHTFIFLLFKGLCQCPSFDIFSYNFDRSLKFYELLNQKGKGSTCSISDLVFISYKLDYSCNFKTTLVTFRALSQYERNELNKYLTSNNYNKIFNKTYYISDTGKISFKNKKALISLAIKEDKFNNLRIIGSSSYYYNNSLAAFNFKNSAAFLNSKYGKIHSFVKMMQIAFAKLGLNVGFTKQPFNKFADFKSAKEILDYKNSYLELINSKANNYSLNLFCADDVNQESLGAFCNKNKINPMFSDRDFLLLQFNKLIKKYFPKFSICISKKSFNSNKKIPEYNSNKTNKFNFIICFSEEYYEQNDIKDRDFHNQSLGIVNQHFTVEKLINLFSNKDNQAEPVIQNTFLEFLIRTFLYESKPIPQKDIDLKNSVMTFVYANTKDDPKSCCNKNRVTYYSYITVDYKKNQIIKNCFSTEISSDKILTPSNKVDLSNIKLDEINNFKDRLICLCQKLAQLYQFSKELIFLTPAFYDENDPNSVQEQDLLVVSPNSSSYVLPDLDSTYEHLSEYDDTTKIKVIELYKHVSSNYQELSEPSGKIKLLLDYLKASKETTINIANLKKALSKLDINGRSAFGIKLSNLIFEKFGSKLYLLSKSEENINNLNIAFYSGIYFKKVDNNHFCFFVSAYNKQDLLKSYCVEKNILLKDVFFHKFSLNTDDFFADYLKMCSNSFARLISKMFSGLPYQIKMCKHLSEARYKSDMPRNGELPLGTPTDSYSPNCK